MPNKEYDHFPYSEDSYMESEEKDRIKNVTRDFLKEGSYLFYEMDDSTLEKELEIEEGEVNPGTYIKHISPLFYDRVINNRDNDYLLDILTEEVPFYHMEAERTFYTDDIFLSTTRDIGLTNVPSPLQDNPFYQTWFRDAIGFVKNSMILDIYNKMRYPYIFENQYLNARIFNRLASILESEDPEGRIGFRTTEDENSEVYKKDYKFFGNEIGCLDYMTDVVESKVNSIYSFLDFNPEYSSFLSDWVESEYKSGKVSYSESLEESLIFRLQDIRGELIRRKLSGTYSLYMALLASMGKTGSYLGVITAGDSNTDAVAYYDEEGNIKGFVKSYNDTRPIRVPTLPGIFTSYNENLDRINPISVFYEKPEEMYKVPLGTIIPLFYNSTDTKFYYTSTTSELDEYDNELFHKALLDETKLGKVDPLNVLNYKEESGVSSLTYRSKFYKDNDSTIYWDNLPGVLTQDSIIKIADTLDSLVEDELTPEVYSYRTLDTQLGFKDDDVLYTTLDNFESKIDLSLVYGSIVDITADEILYHENVLQKNLGSDAYDFVTYPIAEGNGICLMDTSWMNYLEYYSLQKSKVNEDITFGVQISTYIEVDDTLLVPYEFFTYSEDKLDHTIYRVYHNILRYSADTYEVKDVTSTLMTKVKLRLQLDTEGKSKYYDDEGIIKSEYKDYEKFFKYNIGLIPFTYKGLNGTYGGFDDQQNPINPGVEYGSKVESLKIGLEGDKFYNDIDLAGLSEVYFAFSDIDLPVDGINGTDPFTLDGESNVYNDFPTDKILKNIYFIKPRRSAGDVEPRFVWSDPIRVLEHSIVESLRPKKEETSEGAVTISTTFKPDWKGLIYYLNPYLNFTSKSASPLRHKKAVKAYFLDNYDSENNRFNGEYTPFLQEDESPSDGTGLCNLVRMRHMDYLSADLGNCSVSESEGYWNNSSYSGLYLNKSTGSTGVKIWGDNRKSVDASFEYSRISKDYQSYDDLVRALNIENSPLSYNTLYICGNEYYVVIYHGTGDVLKQVSMFRGYSDIYKDSNFIPALYFETLDSEKSPGVSGDRLSLEVIAGNNGQSPLSDDTDYTICAHLFMDSTDSFDIIPGVLSYDGSDIVFGSASIPASKGCHRISASKNGTDYTLIVDETTEKSSTAPQLESSSLNNIFSGFKGTLYDFRIYNEGRSAENLMILNTGMLRETYSYSPSSYKLAHSIYVDNSLIRMVDNSSDNKTSYGIRKIGALRAFNRSVWDSIMLDMYPISTEEADPSSPQYYEDYKNPKDDRDIYDPVVNGNSVKYVLKDCIEQSLLDGFEIFNGKQAKENVTLVHNNKIYKIGPTDYLTTLLSVIQPINCKDESITSKRLLHINNDTLVSPADSSVVIPLKADSSDDYFKYSADLDISFKVSPESSFSWFISRGSNVGMTYHKTLEDSLVSLKDSLIRGSEKNYVMFPLCVPIQSEMAYLDRFNLRNYSLSENMVSFLRAASYYTEIRIPVPCSINSPGYSILDYNYNVGDSISEYISVHGYPEIYELKDDDEFHPIDTRIEPTFKRDKNYYFWNPYREIKTHYNKWDAIRSLKEGDYIFTCKYPMKILPFTDDEFNKGSSVDYNTLYGTMSFKISVKGTPKQITEKEFLKYQNPMGVTEEYLKNNLESTLKDSSRRVDPEDNATFPHRFMSINLYVRTTSGVAGLMDGDNETYDWSWEIIGSNDPSNREAFEDAYIKAESFDSSETYYQQSSEEGWTEVEDPVESDLDIYYLKTSVPKEGVVYLNKETLDDGLIIKKDSPMFLVKNYTEPFFVKNLDRSKEGLITNGSNDDDLIYPIRISPDPTNTLYNENLMVTSENDMDNLVLIGGKSYRVLFDYTSNLSEFTYNISGSEDKVNIKDTSVSVSPSVYLYTSDGETVDSRIVDCLDSKRGYFPKQDPVGDDYWEISEDSSTITCLGDPYSNVLSKNLLAMPGSNIYQSYQIRYLDELYLRNSDGTWSQANQSNIEYRYRYQNLRAYDINDSVSATNISEASIIKYHYDKINSQGLVSGMISSFRGTISGLSFITPNIVVQKENTSLYERTNKEFSIEVSPKALPNETSKDDVNETLYKLCSYQVPSWRIPLRNRFSIIRTGESNYLVGSPDDGTTDTSVEKFDTRYWKYSSTMKFQKIDRSDYSNRLNIYVRMGVSQGLISLLYSKGTATCNAIYDSQIQLYPPEGMHINSVNAVYLDKDNVELDTCELSLSSDPVANQWNVYSGLSSTPVSAVSVRFDINVSRDTISSGDEDPELDYLGIKQARVKWITAKEYLLGLSDAFMGGESFDKSMITVSNILPTFRKSYTRGKEAIETYVPIQFKPETSIANGIYRPIPGIYRAAEFISECAIDKENVSSRRRYLKAPWIRRLNLYFRGSEDNTEVEIHKYGLRKNDLNTMDWREIFSENADIYEKIGNPVSVSPSEDRETFHIDFIGGIKMVLDDDDTISLYKNNLKVSYISLVNEKTSYTYNCFNLEKFRKGLDSYVGITNIQLLDRDLIDKKGSFDDREVIYEIEYLPIIYNELKNHVSFNIMLNHTPSEPLQ